MSKVFKTVALVAAMAASGYAFAGGDGTCAAPFDIGSNPMAGGGAYPGNVDLSNNLCSFTNSLPALGGSGGPQIDAVYAFTAQSANATLSMTHDASFTGVMYLVPVVGGNYCNTSVDPIAFGFQGLDMTVAGLTEGSEYLVVVTADPSGSDAACGTFNVTVAGTLPVELQSFSVE